MYNFYILICLLTKYCPITHNNTSSLCERFHVISYISERVPYFPVIPQKTNCLSCFILLFDFLKKQHFAGIIILIET